MVCIYEKWSHHGEDGGVDAARLIKWAQSRNDLSFWEKKKRGVGDGHESGARIRWTEREQRMMLVKESDNEMAVETPFSTGHVLVQKGLVHVSLIGVGEYFVILSAVPWRAGAEERRNSFRCS